METPVKNLKEIVDNMRARGYIWVATIGVGNYPPDGKSEVSLLYKNPKGKFCVIRPE